MINNKKWIVLDYDREKAVQISKKYNISPLIASVILNRGITSDEAIAGFISKDKSSFHDPYLLSGMNTAVSFIKKAVSDKRKIAVYGDYDVDGITSCYIVFDYLKSIDADVMYYIPDRASEGYGVNKNAIDELKQKGVSLIITVDVGITAVEEALYAKECGLDIIITDHHTPKEHLPDAIAVINPKKDGDMYPNKELAGVGVAYKLIYAMSGCDDEILRKYSQAAAIGTIADMVPLRDENRFIASYGLNELKTSSNVGLNALIEISGINKSRISSANISFALAPRLNAAGRISSATSSVELFLEKDKSRAVKMAIELEDANKIRQSEEHTILEEAEEIIQRDKLYNDNIIIVAKENWHHGVIGIVSSKITEKYYKPSAVISINEDGSAKASGRSVAGFNLFDALSSCNEYLTKFGGHELAAGFSLEKENINIFRKKINEYSKDILTEEMLTPKLIIDGIIPPEDISCSTAEQIDILEPFGIGNRTPLFAVNDALVKSNRVHKTKKHSFFTLEKNRVRFDAPAFNTCEDVASICEGEYICAAGNLNINSFRGIDTVQFVIRDIKSEADSPSDDELRSIFAAIRDYVSKSIFRFKLNDLKKQLMQKGLNTEISKIKTALIIFKELELVISNIQNSNITIKRGKNFYSKCELEGSATYRRIRSEKA